MLLLTLYFGVCLPGASSFCIIEASGFVDYLCQYFVVTTTNIL